MKIHSTKVTTSSQAPLQTTLTTAAAMAAESLDQLLNAEFKEAFDEFDKVRSGVLCN